jgi:TPR repeat protein
MIDQLEDNALRGCAGSQFMLGEAYAKGDGVDVDPYEAMQWFKRAAQQGNAGAQKQVALLYERGVAGDLSAAISWLTKCASQEDPSVGADPDAQLELALLLMRRNDFGDEERARGWMEKAAHRGNSKAQFLLAKAFQRDNKFNRHDREVFHWYQMAADQGHPEAIYEVGLLYEQGQCVAKNVRTALLMFWKAAEQGSISAYLQLGEMYITGVGAPKNDDLAFDCFSKAAAAGEARGQNGVGRVLYARGDYEEAFIRFREAAEQGFANAQHNLAEMYEDGEGVEEDAEQAATWFRKAAEQDSPDSQLKIGMMYQNGHGVPKNKAKAYQWLLLAKANGEPDAASEVEEIERTLSLAERRRGQAAAHNFIRTPQT